MFEQSLYSLLMQNYTGHIEIMVVDDRSTDNTLEIVRIAQASAAANVFAGMRSVRLINGPGRCNWRPGAIHWPVFNQWLATKCKYVGYQFSDDYSDHRRVKIQIDGMEGFGLDWSYCKTVRFVDVNDKFVRKQNYEFTPRMLPSLHLMVPGMLVNAAKFREVGGLDFPIHVGAKAEEWIITHAALLGKPVEAVGELFSFRLHDEALGAKQGPTSSTYVAAVNETGWVEEDHWALWRRVEHVHQAAAMKARKLHGY